MLKKMKLGESGFTLVELMVVVAIIGVLTAVAVPQYSKYVSKARQSEAKVALASILTAERSFVIENNVFTGCAVPISGIQQSGSAAAYYAAGFSSAAGAAPYNGLSYAANSTTPANTCNSNLYASYSLAQAPGFGATAFGTAVGTGGAYGAVNTDTAYAAIAGSATVTPTFKALAAGAIKGGGSTTYDLWTVDHNGSMVNTQSGL